VISIAKSQINDCVLQVKLHQLLVGEGHVVHVMTVTAVTLVRAAAESDVHVAFDFLHVHCARDLTANIVRIFLALALTKKNDTCQ
jgi:hypothetical protein